jgi:hypothetical protein
MTAMGRPRGKLTARFIHYDAGDPLHQEKSARFLLLFALRKEIVHETQQLVLHQPAKHFKPLRQRLIRRSIAQPEVRIAAAEHAAGNHQHVLLQRPLDELHAGQAQRAGTLTNA